MEDIRTIINTRGTMKRKATMSKVVAVTCSEDLVREARKDSQISTTKIVTVLGQQRL
jgi:hypothetical protein